MKNEPFWQKQLQLANGESPLWRFISGIDLCSSLKIDKAFQSVIDEVKELGYSKLSFIELRLFLLNDNGAFNLDKVKCLVSYAIKDNLNKGIVKTIAQQAESSGWLYAQNLVEYVNIRSLGVNAKRNSFVRSGNFLDFIVFMLQSRSSTYHLAPFNRCMMDMVYSPVDMYSILEDIVSEDLLDSGFSPEEQLKLILDFGHSRKEKNAFMIDCLPHTAELSVNYLYKPEQARWISLKPEVIKQNKTVFNKGKKLIKQLLNGETESLDQEVIQQFFSLKNSELNKIFNNDSNKQTKNHKEAIEKLLRTKLVLKTQIISNKNDKEILRKEAIKNWKEGKTADNNEMILSKDHNYNCKKIRQIINGSLGNNYTYKDLQKSEIDYKTSIAKSFIDTHYIFNLPVGPWNGGELELIGFNLSDNRPLYLSKSFVMKDDNVRDVSRHIFGSISRRHLRFENGQLNEDALDELINAYHYWVMLGFDALRIDQVDHVYYDAFDLEEFEEATIQKFYYDNRCAYDTILKQDLKAFISGVKDALTNNIAVLLEDMMHYSMPAVNNVFTRLDYLNADTVIGHLQFMSKMPELLIRLQEHNLIRLYQQTDKFIMSTVECHDNNLTFGGTSPICKDADGITTLRIRLLLSFLGLPYITSQALHGVNASYSKDSQMHSSINHKINLNFKAGVCYNLGEKAFKYDHYRHNVFDFIENKEVKQILKGGIVKIHNKLAENSANGLMFFTVHNKSPHYLLFVINASSEMKKDVTLQNTSLDWYDGERKALFYDLDREHQSKLNPQETFLNMVNTDKYKQTLLLGDMQAGQIRVYKI